MQFIGYVYPGSASALRYNYFEINPSIGYDLGFVALSGGFNYSPDYFAGSGGAFYLYGDAAIPIPLGFIEIYKPAVNLHIGQQWIKDNARFGTPDYTDWSIGASFSIDSFTFTGKYIDTSLSKSDCFGGTRLCRAAGIFEVKYSF